jgi:hypothetical protein
VQAKSKVAPIKPATIPSLELMGYTIAARLTESAKKAMDMEYFAVHYWGDSSTALAWIRRNDEWGTYLGNRVKEILKLSKAGEWRQVTG